MQGLSWRGSLGDLPTPLVVLCAGVVHSTVLLPTLLLLLDLQKLQLAFWSFRILLSVICPSCTCTQLFLAPYSFFVFCGSRRSLSRCQHCSQGSRVPARLIHTGAVGTEVKKKKNPCLPHGHYILMYVCVGEGR